jgi:hypothetical protein
MFDLRVQTWLTYLKKKKKKNTTGKTAEKIWLFVHYFVCDGI